MVHPLLSHGRVEIYNTVRPKRKGVGLNVTYSKSANRVSDPIKIQEMKALLTQQVRVQSQHWSQVRGGLGNDEADQVGVEAGQSEERPGHHSTHGVTDKHHTLGGGLQVLGGREQREHSEFTCWDLELHGRVIYLTGSSV